MRYVTNILAATFFIGLAACNAGKEQADQVDALSAKMCACADIACATGADKELTDWFAKNKALKVSKANFERIKAAATKASGCAAKLGDKAADKLDDDLPESELTPTRRRTRLSSERHVRALDRRPAELVDITWPHLSRRDGASLFCYQIHRLEARLDDWKLAPKDSRASRRQIATATSDDRGGTGARSLGNFPPKSVKLLPRGGEAR